MVEQAMVVLVDALETHMQMEEEVVDIVVVMLKRIIMVDLVQAPTIPVPIKITPQIQEKAMVRL